MKSVWILIFMSVTVNAKTFDLRDVKPRQVIMREDGSAYIEIKTTDDMYERFRLQIRAALEDDRDQFGARRAEFESVGDTHEKRTKFIGFVVPSMAKIYGWKEPNTVFDMTNRQSRQFRPAAAQPAVRSLSDEGAVLVPTCRNPQGQLDIDDPMNQRLLSCYPSLMLFKKFR